MNTTDTPHRGDIFWAELPGEDGIGHEQYGRRPVVVLSVDIVNSNLPICVVVPLTSKLDKPNPMHRIRVPESNKIQELATGGCKGDSLALTEQIRCIDRKRLDPKRVAKLTPVAIAAIEADVKYVLGIP